MLGLRVPGVEGFGVLGFGVPLFAFGVSGLGLGPLVQRLVLRIPDPKI